MFLGDQFHFSIYIITNLKPEYGDVYRGSQKKFINHHHQPDYMGDANMNVKDSFIY